MPLLFLLSSAAPVRQQKLSGGVKSFGNSHYPTPTHEDTLYTLILTPKHTLRWLWRLTIIYPRRSMWKCIVNKYVFYRKSIIFSLVQINIISIFVKKKKKEKKEWISLPTTHLINTITQHRFQEWCMVFKLRNNTADHQCSNHCCVGLCGEACSPRFHVTAQGAVQISFSRVWIHSKALCNHPLTSPIPVFPAR